MLRGPLALSFALALLAAPAFAQQGDAPDTVTLKNGSTVTGKVLDDDPKNGVTIKQANGKVRVIAAKDVKMVDRAETKPPPKPTPKEEEAPPPPPPKTVAAPPDDDEDEPRAQRPMWGAGVELAMTMSRENAQGSLKVLSPDFGIHGSFQTTRGRLYLRVDPTLATFVRRSSVVVPLVVDTTVAGGLAHVEELTNRVRVWDLTLRPMLGYDWSSTFTSRLGVRLGLELASGNGPGCPNDSRTSLGYGLASVPIAAKFGPANAIEVGLFFDYVVLTMPRCSAGDTTDFVIPANVIAKFSLQVSDEKVALGQLGLTATYMFH